MTDLLADPIVAKRGIAPHTGTVYLEAEAGIARLSFMDLVYGPTQIDLYWCYTCDCGWSLDEDPVCWQCGEMRLLRPAEANERYLA